MTAAPKGKAGRLMLTFLKFVIVVSVVPIAAEAIDPDLPALMLTSGLVVGLFVELAGHFVSTGSIKSVFVTAAISVVAGVGIGVARPWLNPPTSIVLSEPASREGLGMSIRLAGYARNLSKGTYVWVYLRTNEAVSYYPRQADLDQQTGRWQATLALCGDQPADTFYRAGVWLVDSVGNEQLLRRIKPDLPLEFVPNFAEPIGEEWRLTRAEPQNPCVSK